MTDVNKLRKVRNKCIIQSGLAFVLAGAYFGITTNEMLDNKGQPLPWACLVAVCVVIGGARANKVKILSDDMRHNKTR